MTNCTDFDPDVLCIGQAVIDCITRGQEETPYKENVWRAENIRLSTGGDAVNEAFALASLGYRVSLIGTVGNDLAGGILLSEARKRGIGTDGITASDSITTPIADLIVRMDGSRYSINSGATKLEGYRPDPELLQTSRAKIISFASLFRAPLDDPETVRQLIRAAHDSGALVCADTKLPTWRKMDLSELSEVLPFIDYIFPNEKEAAYYTGKEQYADMASVFKDHGVRNVIIKTGPEGCFADLSGEVFSLPPLPVPVVDTTGAGDNFVAGFYSGLLRSLPPEQCLKEALRQAAACVQHMGASL
ncbi:MAG: carbohydrate kinase family protein [Lachnospiraceae bacterium]|nr:carbohydrate kinase family protein [Lachnospiraceae bacterium]